MVRVESHSLLSREQLMAEFAELLTHRDMLLAKVQIANLPEIQSQFGDEMAERVSNSIGSLLIEVPHALAVARVTPLLFGLISTNTDDPTVFLHSITHALSDLNREKAFPFVIELGVGAALAQHGSTLGVTAWFERADFALQASRRVGKPELYVESTAVQKAVRDTLSRLSTESDPPEGMYWVFQPVNQISDGKVIGHEALCRWVIPELGPTSPELFIGAAEELGLIHLIDIWSLRNLESVADVIRATGAKTVGFNLSARTLERGPEVLDEVRALIKRNQDLGFQVVIEMTETAVAEDHDRLTSVLDEFRKSGAQIAIDDFGAGHTNLSRIAGLPCDYLKVDGSIIKFIDDHMVLGLLEVAAKMAQLLGAGLVVEGVETAEQLQIAQDAGATHVQGWLFGQPLDPALQGGSSTI